MVRQNTKSMRDEEATVWTALSQRGDIDNKTIIDQDKMSEQEKILPKRRANILDGLLKKSVEAVLPIANDETVPSAGVVSHHLINQTIIHFVAP